MSRVDRGGHVAGLHPAVGSGAHHPAGRAEGGEPLGLVVHGGVLDAAHDDDGPPVGRGPGAVEDREQQQGVRFGRARGEDDLAAAEQGARCLRRASSSAAAAARPAGCGEDGLAWQAVAASAAAASAAGSGGAEAAQSR